MASITVPNSITNTANGHRVRPVGRSGLRAGVIASVSTSVVAGVAHAAGVSLEIGGKAIPVLGFAQMTLLCAAIGIGLAALFVRRVANPRRAFVVTTLALTAASFVPDITADAAMSTKFLLMATHVVAAAIVIPALAGAVADR